MSALLTMSQAATLLGMCERTLREHVRHGEIAYVQKGRGLKRPRKMFDPVDIEAFKARQRRIDCPSTNRNGRRSSTTISKSGVVAFTDLLRKHDGAMPRR